MKKTIKYSLISAALLSSLNAQTVELEPIKVTSATKTLQSIEDVTSNVNVITTEEIKEKHYTTLREALSGIVGINYTSNGGLGSTTSIYLRGAGNNRTLVLVDGIRYQDPSSTSGANIQHLMIQGIEQIEVIKGAQSGIWGADASAGVINIITKSAKKGTSGSVNLEAGSFNTKKFGATISHKTSKFDIKLGANKITSDGFSVQSPINEDIDKYEDDSYSNLTISLKAGYNITDDAKITLNIIDIDALKDYDSFGNPDDKSMKSDISNRLYNLSYAQTYSNHNFTLKVEKSDFSRDEIGTVGAWGSEYVKELEGEYNNIEFNDNIKYNQEDYVIIGLGSSSDDVNYILTDSSNKQKKNKNNYIYLTNSNNINKIILTQSIRYDDYNNFDSKATGKLGIKYNISQNIFVSSNAGLAYNVPNIVQELNPWGAVNSDLNPEDTKSFDISMGYENFKATYFYNEVTDLIEWYDPDGWGGNPAIYKNLDGKSVFKGYEFQYHRNITEEILLSINYYLLSAKDKDGKNLARRPKQTIKLSVDYYPMDSLHVGVFGEYIGKRYDKKDDTGEQTGKYTVINLVSNYDINKNFSAYIKVDNLFDKYYQVVDGYATAPLSAYIGINAKF
ncbi:MAG: TonB-dependent receptor [Sulfurimonas sp.]|nr:TonB-dependent receptor [Sulfurimonas sp.]